MTLFGRTRPGWFGWLRVGPPDVTLRDVTQEGGDACSLICSFSADGESVVTQDLASEQGSELRLKDKHGGTR